jgi:glycosyltransferase involved in cell wall biosynthesis
MLARWFGYRRAYFLSDTNFVSWRVGAFLARCAPPTSQSAWARGLRVIFGETFLFEGWPVMHRQSCHFASRFLQAWAGRAGIDPAPETSVVAHWGIDPAQFTRDPRPRWPVRRLLYVGQLIPQKGVHTLVGAFGLLAKEPGFAELSLTIVGGGLHPEYEQTLRALPGQLGIAGRVHFLGKVSRADLPQVYAEHDVLIFPSEWDEPFAITPLEAMASGLAVVGTTTGGSGELFVERETALTFSAGDAADCARALRELCANQELHGRISRNARADVCAHYVLERMVTTIEEALQKLRVAR